MELIDDWTFDKQAVPQPPGDNGSPTLASRFHEGLTAFTPQPLTLHCYEDVGHPWVQIVFEHLIAPDVALRLGEALTAVPGAGTIYVNSLRPKAVYLLVEPARDTRRPELAASRYGVTVAELRRTWG